MNKLRDKIEKFMYGRYGMDQLGNFSLWAALTLMVLGVISGNSLLYLISIVAVIWCYMRIFSKNHSKRCAENQKYLELKNRLMDLFRSGGRSLKDREHRYFRCPHCNQQVRVPRGKGQIEIRCPKCGTRFRKRT